LGLPYHYLPFAFFLIQCGLQIFVEDAPMPRQPKTNAEKMNAKPPHTVRLDKAFAGVPAGALMLISSPQEVAAHLVSLPRGTTMPIQSFRQSLATLHQCDAACPVSTAIFLKIVAEHAWEQIQAGTPLSEVPPFWRVLDPKTPLAKKLSFDAEWITLQRELEQS
jgi:hypothetical protein